MSHTYFPSRRTETRAGGEEVPPAPSCCRRHAPPSATNPPARRPAMPAQPAIDTRQSTITSTRTLMLSNAQGTRRDAHLTWFCARVCTPDEVASEVAGGPARSSQTTTSSSRFCFALCRRVSWVGAVRANVGRDARAPRWGAATSILRVSALRVERGRPGATGPTPSLSVGPPKSSANRQSPTDDRLPPLSSLDTRVLTK
jgi:hypothetical protein